MGAEIKEGIVEKITNGGWGLVRSDEGVVFLNYAIPGEHIFYKIRDKARGILWGALDSIKIPSPSRITPPCPYYGQCGGCIFQHMDYSLQQLIKLDILRDDLLRIGHFSSSPDALIPSPPYNNRIRARMKAQDDGRIGFIRKSSNTVIAINRCLLFPEEINQFLDRWNSLSAPPFFHQMDILVNPATRQPLIHLSHPPGKLKSLLSEFNGIAFSWKGHEENAVTSFNIGEYRYLTAPSVFFQVNPHQWENMLKTVELYLHPCERIIDLYSGVGFFTPLLQKYAGEVTGVECSPFSVTLARRAFPDARWFSVPAEKFQFPPAEIIVLDPPRSGLAQEVISTILKKKYKKIIYIACSSAAFSRDLRILKENGYEVVGLHAFDLFPQTAHLETIACFTLR